MQANISIVIITYNGARFIREQLDSLYSQSLIPAEIVVCDNCSTDQTVSILEDYKKTNILRYFVNEQQLDLNECYFKAISLCAGDYIAICYQDGVCLSNKLEKCYYKIKEIEGDRLAVVYSEKHDIDVDGNIIRINKQKKDHRGYTNTLLKPYYTCQGCCLFFNRALAKYVLNKYYESPFESSYLMYDAFIAYTGAMIGEKYDLASALLLFRRYDKNEIKQSKIKSLINKNYSFENRFCGFIPNKKIKGIIKIYELLYEDIANKDIQLLVDKLKRIEVSKSTFKGLVLVFTIKELSFFDKIKIFVNTLLIHLLYPLKKAISVS